MSHLKNISLLVVLCCSCYLINLGLFEPDLMEARNFVTAREMIQNDNWLIPTMNNELRLEKQPFVTWLTALSALAGNSITDLFILRLPAAIVTIFMVLFFYALCFELSRKPVFALIGGAVFATSLLVVQMSMVNSWDIFTHAFMLGSIWLQVKAFNNSQNNIGIWMGAALLFSLSVFSKGPISLYALWLPFIISYYFFYAKHKVQKNVLKLVLMLIFGLLAGFAWNIYLYFEIPEQLSEVLIKEASARGTRHVRPFYFYFHFPVYIGIWTIPLLASLFFKKMRHKINEEGNYRMIIAWLLIGLFLLSIIPEKKERYMLPLEVPMSLLVAYLLYSIYGSLKYNLSDYAGRIMVRIHGWIIILILFFLPISAMFTMKNEFYSIPFISGALVSFILGICLIRETIKLKEETGFKIIFASTLITVILISAIYLPVLARLTYNPDFRDVAVIGNNKNYNNTMFISAGALNMELIWRIGRPVEPVDVSTFEFSDHNQVILFSYEPAENYLVISQLEKVELINLGTFDCNKDKGKCKLYVYNIKRKI